MIKLEKNRFDEFYEILEEAFPVTERRAKEGQKLLLEDADYTIWAKLSEKQKIEAILAVWTLENSLFIEHFAVAKELRGKGTGTCLLKQFLKAQSQKIILEVELPDYEMAEKRIAFYKQLGFCLNEYEYFQPPMQKGQEKMPLMIMSYPDFLDTQSFEDFKKAVYQKVYKVKEML